MKPVLYLLIVVFMESCNDDPESNISINDVQGISIDLSWANSEPKNNDGIGLTIYDPANTVIYQAYDTVVIYNHLPDGQYIVEVVVYSALDKTDYKLQVKGATKTEIYTFDHSFSTSDDIGFTKRVLLIDKDKGDYTLKLP